MSTIETIPLEHLNRRLIQKTLELRTPYTATIEISYGCNLRCVHCYNPTHKVLPGEMKREEIYNVLDQLAQAGCFQVAFSGGEPLLRPDAFELFTYAQKIGLGIALLTNATLIDQDKIERLKQLAPRHLSISVYGMTRETYESVTRVPGSFAKFQHGLKLVRESGIPFETKMPVMIQNVHELEMAREWFRREQIPFGHSLEIHPRSDGNPEPLKVRLPAELAAELRLKHSGEDRSCLRTNDLSPEDAAKVFSCSCGKNSLAVSPYGEMNLCVTMHYPKYSLKTGSVKEGWQLLVQFVEGVKPDSHFECPQCDLAAYCTQGAMDAWLSTGQYTPCVPYFKQTARNVRDWILNQRTLPLSAEPIGS